ncbi:MAG: glycosyltransferase 87 family protein [Solirubrobacterales bacterium]
MRRSLATVLLVCACLLQGAPGAAGAAIDLRASPLGKSTAASTSSETPVPVSPSIVPPAGRRLSSDDVLEIAGRLAKMRRERDRYPGSYSGAYLKGPTRWQVSYFSRKGREIGQVIIADASGRVLEQWTGFQVAWTMARGYSGAFGRHVNALYIWLPLCVLFAVPFITWRRPLSLRNLDLLALLSFSVSLAYFNHGDLYKSVPLAYPPLVYLLVRMLLLVRLPRSPPPDRDAFDGAAGSAGATVARAPIEARRPPQRLRLAIPAPWLALGVVFLLGFRIGLNVTDSNVIDVGYAGVIGAQRIAHDRALYGGYPSNNEHGDTYGPANYEAYVPFQQIFGWSGQWDDLPAAHAAAIAFDLLAVGLLFLLGLRLGCATLGIALSYAWVSYPFTLYALESNSNDTLVAVLLLAVLLVAVSPPARGVFAALAGLTKLAPLALVPLFATHELRRRSLALFVLAFALTVAVVSIPALTHDSLHRIYERTFAYQDNRGSPFSVWGLYGGLKGWQTAVQIAAVGLALGLAVIRRVSGPGSTVSLAAAAAAILIALQLGIEHWFYLYIPWFFPLVMIALLAPRGESPGATPMPASALGATPMGASAVSASEPARSSPLAAA